MTRRLFSLILLNFTLLACDKKPQVVQTDFLLELSADDAFNKVINTLVSQSFSTDQIDSSARSVQTDMKEISLDTLKSFAKLQDADNRYEKGRYGYKISVQEEGDKSKVHIDAMVEGYYRALQSQSKSFGVDKDWQPQLSNGVAEKQLFASVK